MTGEEFWAVYTATANPRRPKPFPTWKQLTKRQREHLEEGARQMDETLSAHEKPVKKITKKPTKVANPVIVNHEIDPEKVAEQVTKKIDGAYESYARAMDSFRGLDDIEARVAEEQERLDERVYDELTYYIHVYVQEDNPKKFWLAYKSAETSMTGAFVSRQKAEEWFMRGGR